MRKFALSYNVMVSESVIKPGIKLGNPLMRRSHQARSVTSATIDQSQLIATLF